MFKGDFMEFYGWLNLLVMTNIAAERSTMLINGKNHYFDDHFNSNFDITGGYL